MICMKVKQKKRKRDQGISLFLSIILIFCILSVAVFSVGRKISAEMSASAIQNLSESLDLIKCMVEAVLNKEAEFQKLMAQEIAAADDPKKYISSYGKNQTMVKISLMQKDENEGISNTGEIFTKEELDFSAGGTVEGLPVSRSYINYMGTWAYTMQCPVKQDGRETSELYIEYVYYSLDRSLPDGFYNEKAMLYVMDAQSRRLVLKPKGMGERSAGHLNLEDFFTANDILNEELQAEVSDCIAGSRNMMFYHDIRGKSSLIYMWSVNDGMLYLIGYVPVEAVQQEGRTVNQNILIVVVVMLTAFFLCCMLYYLNQRQQNKIRKEREAEREIHNRQLAEALQAAQIASQSKTMFLSNMSHDIRTPMNAVLGFTALLVRNADNSEKVREYTKKIRASGEHLLSLINDVLDVSKIESGKVVLAIEEFTLNDLVTSVDAIIRPMADQKRQKFEIEVANIEHEHLLGDETRMNQILINLLSNAVKYTPQGGSIWFRILGLKQRSSQYERIRIEVQDNGYGMTKEYLRTVFDPFTRAENSTTNKVQGTGLGMAITKNLVELMGGTIGVTSEIDQGSLFRVELELRISKEQEYKQFWKKSGISRVLVVTSDMECGKNIQMQTADVGVLVQTVFHMDEAMRLISENNGGQACCHAVILDWDTTAASAVQLADELRSALPDTVPILFLTANDADGIEEALQIKNTGMLSKPFFVSAFEEKIMELQACHDSEALQETDETGSLKGLHFLAAEDNEINSEILREILSFEGAECEIVENGRLAVERFEAAAVGEFDAILMDVQMPVMNGYEAARAIRMLKRTDAGTIPIIAMTANAFAEDEKEALDAGMNVHLAKPVDIVLLRKVIKQYVT